MSFSQYEIAEHAGKPIELYQFSVGNASYYYTSANMSLNKFGRIWETSPGLSHTEIRQTGEKKDDVNITVDYHHPISTIFSQYAQTQELKLTIYAVQEDDAADEQIFLVSGTIRGRSVQYPTTTFVMRPSDGDISQSVLYRSYGADNQFEMYDGLGGIDELEFSVNATITQVNSLVLSVDLNAHAADYFVAGTLKTAGNLRGFIRAQTNTSITLDRIIPGLSASDVVQLIPSDRGSFERMHTIFNRREAFFGAPYANKINPFVGDGIGGDK